MTGPDDQNVDGVDVPVDPTQEASPAPVETAESSAPSPEDVTTFDEDDDPESLSGDVVDETAEEKAADSEVDADV